MKSPKRLNNNLISLAHKLIKENLPDLQKSIKEFKSEGITDNGICLTNSEVPNTQIILWRAMSCSVTLSNFKVTFRTKINTEIGEYPIDGTYTKTGKFLDAGTGLLGYLPKKGSKDILAERFGKV